MYILNIAEKPSVAKSISKVLSQTITSQRGKHKYCNNIHFKYNEDNFIFTSVLGHIYSLNFTEKYLWEAIDPKILFFKPLSKNIQEDFLNLKKNLEEQASRCEKVIIWTDCDREGEHIALQISNIIKNKKNILIKRARFSGITRNDIKNAIDNLVDINLNEADAVDCRMEMDLRIGSSFTILQTLSLKGLFSTKKVVSFGPCQIPTLGFVVEKYWEIENFIEEDFYFLELKIDEDIWLWKRGHVFDKNCISYFYNMLINTIPIVIKKDVKPVTKLKPLPLRTVEFQKICSSLLRISSHKLMTIAESLYNKGYISYPRTETDSFNKNFNFKSLLNKLSTGDEYSEIIENISKNIKLPRSGKNNDMAHSPIYPLKGGNDLTGTDKLVYNFIIRRFLGSLCDDAKGLETSYELKLDKEIFYIKGLKILERNYLEVYTFDKWNNKEINDYEINKEIKKYNLDIKIGKTTPPSFLTESDLISLMDKNEIGTDATIHEHIQKIQERSYVKKINNFIIPEKLGIGLIKGFNKLNLSVSKPLLRKNTEINLKNISNGSVTKDDVIKKEIELYCSIYTCLSENINIFKKIVEDEVNSSSNNYNSILDSDLNLKNNAKNEKLIIKNKLNNEIISTKNKINNEKLSKKNKIINEIISTKNEVSSKKNKINNDKLSKKSDKENINDKTILCTCKKLCIYASSKNKIFYKCGSNPPKCNFKFTEEVKCNCKYDPKILMSFTENNKNRKFFKCNKSYKPCKFFKWAESKND